MTTDDEKRLRLIAETEIQAVMDKHRVGGVVILVSEDAAAWNVVFPEWSGLQPDPRHGMRLRLHSKTDPPGKADATMHMVASLRELSSEVANAFGNMWRVAKRALEAQGAVVEHTPFGGSRGMFPGGRKGG